MRLSWMSNVAAGLFCLVSWHAAQAGVFTVPGHFPSIQAAIDGAPDGSLIHVSPGTYGFAQALNVSKRLYFLAVDGPEHTVISGGRASQLLRIDSVASDPARTLIFDGFTFRDGRASGDLSPITIAHAQPVFINCIFRDNHATEKGGAIVLYGATARAYFLNCTFLRNTSDRTAGAVLAAGGAPAAFFKNCRFLENSNRTSAGTNRNQGGALHFNDATGRIVNSLFRGNSAAYAGGAVMLLQWWDRPEIRFDIWGCRFEDNFALPIPGRPSVPEPSEGGAVMAENNLVADLRGNVFEGNAAMAGGAVQSYRAHMDLSDSVFDGNRAVGTDRLGYGGALGISLDDAGDADRREARIRLERVLVRNNIAPVGGGLFAAGDLTYGKRGRLTLDQVTFDGNLATTDGNSLGHGGGIFLHQMRMDASEVYLLNNTAEGYGGAAGIIGGTALTLTDSLIVGHSASVDPVFHDPEEVGVALVNSVIAYNEGSPAATFSRFSAVPDVSFGADAWLTWAVAPTPPAPVLSPPGVALAGSPFSAGSRNAGPVAQDTWFQLATGQGPLQAEVIQARNGLREVAWSGIPVLPARVEAEDFDRLGEGASYRDQTPVNQGGAYRPGEGVDIAASSAASNGHYVGWTEAGEWLEYTVRTSAFLSGRIDMAVASVQPGGAFYVQVNDETVSPLIEVPETGAGTAWQTVSVPGVFLPEGLHEVRIIVVRGGFHLDYWAFVAESPLRPSPGALWRTVKEGNRAVGHAIELRHAGTGTLDFHAVSNAPWLSVRPQTGSVGKDPVTLSVRYDSAGLDVGTYRGRITLTPVGVEASPETVAVTLNVRPQGSYRLDFDGDGAADLGVFFPPTGAWYVFRSSEGFFQTEFGAPGTLPIVGDFDGDGRADYGYYHPPTGMWRLALSAGGEREVQFGFDGTIPIVGDFDGDGIDDFGCYHPPTGMWYIFRSSEGFLQVQFGFDGTIPVVGDFDGDGIDDFGCYHPPTGMWYIFRSRAGFLQVQFGFNGTIPVVGDFDGDGIDDFGCYHPPTGAWYVFRSREGFWQTQFGYEGTLPVVGDFDGDGRSDLAVYDPPGGAWFIFGTQRGFFIEQFGFEGTLPLGGPPVVR